MVGKALCVSESVSDFLKNLGYLRHLTTLDISDNPQLKDIPAGCFSGVARLENLHLNNCNVSFFVCVFYTELSFPSPLDIRF